MQNRHPPDTGRLEELPLNGVSRPKKQQVGRASGLALLSPTSWTFDFERIFVCEISARDSWEKGGALCLEGGVKEWPHSGDFDSI